MMLVFSLFSARKDTIYSPKYCPFSPKNIHYFTIE